MHFFLYTSDSLMISTANNNKARVRKKTMYHYLGYSVYQGEKSYFSLDRVKNVMIFSTSLSVFWPVVILPKERPLKWEVLSSSGA
jgi:hypothetical protein